MSNVSDSENEKEDEKIFIEKKEQNAENNYL